MSALWPDWLRPWWLLLIPLLAWLLWRLSRRQRQLGQWQALLAPAFHAALLHGGGPGRRGRPWLLLGAGWLLALLALLGPSWQQVQIPGQKHADPLVVVLELSPRMLAGDGTPTRLDQARHKLLDLLRARQEAQTAIVVYAGSAHVLVPLSNDLATSHNLLEALQPSIMPEPGQRADLAVARAADLLRQAGQGHGRILLVTSALSPEERQGIRRALGRVPLRILGVGTRQGAPIAEEDGGFLKDAAGAILLPRLDAAGLSTFASSVSGRYAGISLDDDDLEQLGLLEQPRQLEEDRSGPLSLPLDQGYWLLLPLLLLTACAGRRGWLLCLPLLCGLFAPPSQAFELRDLWLRADQQGQRLLEAQRPAQAARRFQDPQWQGLALYQAGDYSAAASRFAQDDSAAGHYNRANALAMAGELEAALDAYEQALERQPELAPALANKALVEQLLRQREEQRQSPEEPVAATRPEGLGQTADDDSPPATPATEAREDGGSPDGEGPPGGALDSEQRQAMDQWLRQIPDDPGELLRRKFWYEQQQRQDTPR